MQEICQSTYRKKTRYVYENQMPHMIPYSIYGHGHNGNYQ